MIPALRRWAVSLSFGLLAGWLAGGAIVAALGALPIEGVHPLLALALQGAVVAAVTLGLARIPDPRRRLGWGCLALGGAILLNGVALLLLTGVLGWLLGHGPARDEASAAFFVLLLSLPYVLLCVVMLIGGALLLRRTRAPAARTGAA